MTQPRTTAPDGMTRPPRRGTRSLADILERVLDKGIVIAGDIRVDLLDIELLTIRIRLLSRPSTRRARWASTGGSTTRPCPRAPGIWLRKTGSCATASASWRRLARGGMRSGDEFHRDLGVRGHSRHRSGRPG